MSKKSGQEWLLSNNDYNKSKLEPGTKVDSRSGQSEKEEVNNFRLTKAHTISVTGGKGGVGKSSVTIKLGKILAQFGFRVLIFDCDYNLSNITVKLGYPLNNNFYDLINNYKTFEECVLRIDNLHILPGCNGNLDLFKKDILFDQFVINLLMNQEKKYDFILLDCPAGARKEYLTINAYSDYRFLVVNPDKSSITDSYSLMKILKQSYGIKENHLLINKAENKNQIRRIVKVLGETVESFLNGRLYFLGAIFRESFEVESFDRNLLKNADSKIHRNFLKVSKEFVEKTFGITVPLQGKQSSHLIPQKGGGQEVRTNP